MGIDLRVSHQMAVLSSGSCQTQLQTMSRTSLSHVEQEFLIELFDLSGKILLCVLPSLGQEALHSVKWHPKQYNTVAVASENDIYVLNISEAARFFDGEPIIQSDLHRFVQSVRMPAVSSISTCCGRNGLSRS